jgi:integrase
MNYSGCRPFSESELDLILNACSGRYEQRDRTLIVMGVHTGFRIRELLSLRISDVWDGSCIRNSVTVARGFMKCKLRSRTMPLHPRVREEIALLIRAKAEHGAIDPSCPLFNKQKTDKPLSTRQAYDILLSAAEKAGIEVARVGTHSLRKTFARRMWTSPLVNHDPAKMARLLGHENWSNTLRYLEFADELENAVLSA